MEEKASLSKKALAIGVIIGLVIGFGMGYGIAQQGTSDFEKNNQISQLQSQISEKESQITVLQSQITDLKSQVSELQSEIEELEKLLPTLKRGTWNLIETFSGKSGVTTDYFYVAGTELRINWTWSSSAEEYAGFSFYLYREGQTTWTSSLFNLQKEGTNYIHNIKSASYYLDILEANLDQWTVTIEVWIQE